MKSSIFILFLSFFAISCKVDDGDNSLLFDSLKTLYNNNVEAMDRVSRSLEFMPLASDYIFGTEEERASIEADKLAGYEISHDDNFWSFTLGDKASYTIKHNDLEYSHIKSEWVVNYKDNDVYYENDTNTSKGSANIEIVSLDLNNKGVQGEVINIRDNDNTTLFRMNLAVNADVSEGVYSYEGDSVMLVFEKPEKESYKHKYSHCKTSINDTDRNLLDGNIVIDRVSNNQQLAKIMITSNAVVISSAGEEVPYVK